MNLFRIIVLAMTLGVTASKIVAHEWKQWGNLSGPRAFGYAAAISPTSAIVFGGFPDFDPTSQVFGSSVLKTCEILDVKTGTVRQASPTAVGHADGPVVRMSNGKVVVLGGLTDGDGNTTTLVEEFDPASETWTSKGNLLYSRRQHEAIAIDDHRIMVVCGRGPDRAGTQTTEIFDLTTGTSTALPTFPHQLTNFELMIVDSNVYVVGGREGAPSNPRSKKVYFYSEPANDWVLAFELPIQMPLIEGVKVFGGMFTSGGSTNMADSKFSDVVYFVNGVGATPLTGRLETSVKGHSMVSWVNDTLIVFGGENGFSSSAKESSWINTITGVVSLGPELNVARRYGMAVQLDGDGSTPPCVFAIGGALSGNSLTPSVEILIAGVCSESSTTSLLNASTTSTVGAARFTSKPSVLLTGTTEYSKGAVWYRSKVVVRSGLSTSFSFRFIDGSDKSQPDGGPPGADGIALVIQNGEPTPLGASGQGIGYEDITNGIAVEFDSYLNASYSDPSASHVAVQSQRDRKLKPWHRPGYNLGLTSDIPVLRSDGTVYYARVDFNDSGVDVYLDTMPTLTQPVLSIQDVSISSLISMGLDGAAYIGITSATGFSVQEHELLSWTIQGCNIGTVGVDDAQSEDVLNGQPSIVPMPSLDIATLRWNGMLSSGTVSVYDATGYLHWSKHVTPFELEQGVLMPAGEFSSGLYIIQISMLNALKSIAWIIQ
ncbi:MAG: hypothetical protein SGJ05_06115 [bacterium]|nr:hypothetical protein [bacterium]